MTTRTLDAIRARAHGDEFARDLDDAFLMLVRSLRQMVAAGAAYAMVPDDLVPGRSAAAYWVSLALDEVDGDWATSTRAGNVCGAIFADAGVLWVCLDDACTARELAGVHAWPTHAGRHLAARALVEQVDPIARIERRVAYALEGDCAHPLLAGMPTA